MQRSTKIDGPCFIPCCFSEAWKRSIPGDSGGAHQKIDRTTMEISPHGGFIPHVEIGAARRRDRPAGRLQGGCNRTAECTCPAGNNRMLHFLFHPGARMTLDHGIGQVWLADSKVPKARNPTNPEMLVNNVRTNAEGTFPNHEEAESSGSHGHSCPSCSFRGTPDTMPGNTPCGGLFTVRRRRSYEVKNQIFIRELERRQAP